MKGTILFRFALVSLSLLGAGMVYLSTSQLGPGLGEDSAKYLSVAENLVAGNGFITYQHYPLTQWPPLYPLMLAIVEKGAGIDTLVVAQYLNILAVGLLIWIGGTYFYQVFNHRIVRSLFATAVLTFSPPLISIASNISSDPLFIVLVILFLTAAVNYLSTKSSKSLGLMCLWAMLASLVRFAGLSLILSGTVILLTSNKLKKRAAYALAFALITGLPLFAWAYFHNYLLGYPLFGHHLPALPLGNIVVTVDKVLGWFIPLTVLKLVGRWSVVLTIAVLLITGNKREDWAMWKRTLNQVEILPSLVFLTIYIGMLIFSTSYTEARVTGFDRIHLVILLPLLVVGIASFDLLFPKYLLKLRTRNRNLLFALLMLVFLVFPIYRTQKFVRSAILKGDTNYNYINTRELRESDLVAFLHQLDLGDEEVLYSNNEALAWYYTRQRILDMPKNDVTYGGNILESGEWPRTGESGYFIWFTGSLDYKPGVVFPEEARNRGWIILEFVGDYGEVYRITR
jgi:hypothetical protein